MQCLQDSVSIVLPGSAPPAPTVSLARFPWSDPARRGPEPSRRSPVASPADVYQALREAHARADADAAAHRGRDEIRNYLAAYFARRGPVEVTVKREVDADSSVLAEWTSSYT